MALPVNVVNVYKFAHSLYTSVRAFHSLVSSAKTALDTPNYELTLQIPAQNKNLQAQRATFDAMNASQQSAVKQAIDDSYAETIVLADIGAIITEAATLSTLIENNASEFLMTLNATTKRPEYITAIAAGKKTALSNAMDALLAKGS